MFRHLLVACWFLTSANALAQDKPLGVDEFKEFNEKPLDGWVWDVDDRLEDLVLQLQEKELLLQEIDTQIARATGKKRGSKMAENMAWRSTQRMDLNGGGPIRWDAFYGRNAEKFFYHPTDRNTTYHTTTALRQVAPTSAGGVPGNQGVPAHQRPPQFDYIYRGYEDARDRAREEAKKIENRIEDMESRRRELEGEVVVLWMKLAFRVIDRDKLPENPSLRFAFRPRAADKENAGEQAAALTTATQFLATAMLFSDALAEKSRETAFGGVSETITRSRKAFEDGFIKLSSLRNEAADKSKPLGQFKLLSRQLEDAAKMLADGYKDWRAGDKNDEESTKFSGLRRIQDGVVRYSQILLALNELVGQLEEGWEVELNTDSTEFKPRWHVALMPMPDPVRPPAPKSVNLLDGLDIQAATKSGRWRKQGDTLVGGGPEVAHLVFRSPAAAAFAKQDYKLTMEFSVRSDSTGFSDINLFMPGVPAVLAFRNLRDANASRVYFHHDNHRVDDLQRFQPNKRYSSIIVVRDNGKSVTVSIDNKTVFHREGFVDKAGPPTFEIQVSPAAEVMLYGYTVSRP